MCRCHGGGRFLLFLPLSAWMLSGGSAERLKGSDAALCWLACDSIWAGGGGRTGMERREASSYPLTPFAQGLPGFCTESCKSQDTSQSCDNQDGWSPHCTKLPKPAGLVSQETHPRSQGRRPLTTSSAPHLHFSGGSMRQDTWFPSDLGQGLFPGQECGDTAEGRSRLGNWSPLGGE